MKADLHVHSRVSDGSCTIPELAAAAAQKGLDVIAVTDHDTLAHRKQIPADAPVRVLCGIEISCRDYESGKKAHILGYGIQNDAMVENFVHPVLEARHENSLKQIEILKKNGYEIDTGKLRRADGRYIYKQHIMEYLVSTGQAPDMFGDFYHTVFKNGGICDFEILYLNPYEAVRVVKEAGGLPVLAHPGQQQNFALIPGLVQEGLAGLERNHPANTGRDHEIIEEYAARYGLFLTGGSDFHGKFEKDPSGFGRYLSEESGIKAVCGI